MKILIADDEAAMCHYLADILEQEGHTCSIVRDGPEVNRILSGIPFYDLAIVDVVMPKSTGPESVCLATVFGCDIPIIYVSGLPLNEVGIENVDEKHFLQKPFIKDDILSKIKEVIKGD